MSEQNHYEAPREQAAGWQTRPWQQPSADHPWQWPAMPAGYGAQQGAAGYPVPEGPAGYPAQQAQGAFPSAQPYGVSPAQPASGGYPAQQFTPYPPQQQGPQAYPQQFQQGLPAYGQAPVVINNNVQAVAVGGYGPRKSVGVALLLTILFGPLGMFYSTVSGALIMLGVSFVLALFTAGLSVLVTWPICVIWGCMAASRSGGATVHQTTLR